jgi:hypothetical protein
MGTLLERVFDRLIQRERTSLLLPAVPVCLFHACEALFKMLLVDLARQRLERAAIRAARGA